jgi:hypothetical protein
LNFYRHFVEGVIAAPVFPQRPGGNTHLSHETDCKTLYERLEHLIEGVDVVVAMPGVCRISFYVPVWLVPFRVYQAWMAGFIPRERCITCTGNWHND